jgi:hypothetical protein
MVARECATCEQPFVVEPVVALALDLDGQSVCLACIEYFGRRNPEKFPTIAEYEEAKRRYPEPIYASTEELTRLDPWMEYDNSIDRPQA